jgi:hypothetical protein
MPSSVLLNSEARFHSSHNLSSGNSWNDRDNNGIHLFFKIEIPHIPKMKVQFHFFSGQWQSYFGYIPNLYNLAGFFKSFGQIARSAPYFQYGFAIIFWIKAL